MSPQQNIPGGYSTSQAAERLGVSRHEVARLVRAGTLDARMIDAGLYVVDPGSVQRRAAATVLRGRPWDARTAWAALLALEGEGDLGIAYHAERRLRRRLAEVSAEELAALSGKRMRVIRYRCAPSFADDVRGSLSLSGVSSPWASDMGLAVSACDGIDGYVLRAEADIVRDCFLIADAGGGCVLREARDLPEPLRGLPSMPPTVAAADLALSADERERRCGLDFLEGRLREYRES